MRNDAAIVSNVARRLGRNDADGTTKVTEDTKGKGVIGDVDDREPKSADGFTSMNDRLPSAFVPFVVQNQLHRSG